MELRNLNQNSKCLPWIVYITFSSAEVGAAPIQDVAVHLEMFARTYPHELAQGTTQDVPCRKLAPNIATHKPSFHPTNVGL